MKQLEHVPVTDAQRAALIEMAHAQRMNRAELWREAMAAYFADNGVEWPEWSDERRKPESEMK